MAARSAPRTMAALSNMEIRTRSDYAAWCQGVENLAHQLSLEVLTTADDVYRMLARSGGAGVRDRFAARALAWQVTRPLRNVAADLRNSGRLAVRAFRLYTRRYEGEITPAKKTKTFDHTK